MDAFFAFLSANGSVIICLLAGFALLMLEVFIPGFSAAGILGGIALLAGVVLTFIRHGAIPGLIVLFAVLVIAAIIGVQAYRSIMRGRLSRSSMVLSEASNGSAAQDLTHLLGQEGETATDLHPGGSALFGDTTIAVVADGTYIKWGTRIRVSKVEGTKIIVKSLEK